MKILIVSKDNPWTRKLVHKLYKTKYHETDTDILYSYNKQNHTRSHNYHIFKNNKYLLKLIIRTLRLYINILRTFSYYVEDDNNVSIFI